MILTVTYNPAVDQTVQVEEPFRPETINRARDARYDPGGKGINVSQFLHALDAETVATGLLGGFTGEYVRDSLADEGVPADFVEIDGRTRLNTTVLAADGEYKLNQSGPQVDYAAVDELLDVVEGYDPDFVHVAGSLPPGLDATAIDGLARAGDWRTVVDVNGPVLAALDAEYAVCTPNRPELGEATGSPVSTIAECASAAAELRADGFETVLASLGEDGALLVDGDRVLHAELPAVEVVDTVGAGDALVAGYLAAIDAGRGPQFALRHAIAAASRVVGQVGTGAPAFEDLSPTRGDVSVTSL